VGGSAALLPRLSLVVALLALPACAHHRIGDTPTHDAHSLVPFDPPPSYPDISWMGSLDEARVRAADEHKPMIVFIRAAWAQPSVVMETTVWHDSRVLAEASRFVALRVDLTSSYGAPIPDFLKDYDVKGVPTTIIVSSEGKILGRFTVGKARPAEVAAAMRDAK
jgi:thiol:disulfide interchange protein